MLTVAIAFWIQWVMTVALLIAFDLAYRDKPDTMLNVLEGAACAALSTALGAILC